jgi:hypothetical protein
MTHRAGQVVAIMLTPGTASMAVNSARQYTAVGVDAQGNTMAITTVWAVVNGGGTISATGLFTAGAVAGSFANTVRATLGNLSATASASVITNAGALATIVITPTPTSMLVNTTRQFVATGFDAAGNSVAITPLWSIVAGGGTIDAAGLFTAGAVGGTFANTVRVTSGTITGTATVTVSATTGLRAKP